MNDSDDIVKEFLVESYENLDRLDRDLVTLEKDPNDREILASIFRTIHTIKGTSGFLAFDKLGAVAHVGESLLGLLRDGQKALDRDITSALLAMVDAVRQILASIEATGVEGDRDDDGLISRLTRLQGVSEAPTKNKSAAPAEAKAMAAAAGASHEGSAAKASTPAPKIVGVKIDGAVAEPTLAERAVPPAIAVETPAVPGQSASDRTIRLDVALLDQLMMSRKTPAVLQSMCYSARPLKLTVPMFWGWCLPAWGRTALADRQ